MDTIQYHLYYININSSGAIDLEMDESILDEKLSFWVLELSFPSILDCGSYIVCHQNYL